MLSHGASQSRDGHLISQPGLWCQQSRAGGQDDVMRLETDARDDGSAGWGWGGSGQGKGDTRTGHVSLMTERECMSVRVCYPNKKNDPR